MRKLAQEECGFEEPTVAMAFVYFEKLALKGKLNKQNRKLCAGACVLLAAKIGSDLRKHEVKHLIDVRIHRFPVFLLHEVLVWRLHKRACQWSCSPLAFQLYSQLNTIFLLHVYVEVIVINVTAETWEAHVMSLKTLVSETLGSERNLTTILSIQVKINLQEINFAFNYVFKSVNRDFPSRGECRYEFQRESSRLSGL